MSIPFPIRLVSVLAITAVTLVGCASTPAATTSQNETSSDGCDGIAVVVNYGDLGAETQDSCVSLEGETIAASEVIDSVGLEVEGTAKYGDQIVCRVNGLPSADEPVIVDGQDPHTETCADMPPQFAYWALFIKKTSDGAWEYATEGLGTLQLNKGESLGLIFTTGDQTPTPN